MASSAKRTILAEVKHTPWMYYWPFILLGGFILGNLVNYAIHSTILYVVLIALAAILILASLLEPWSHSFGLFIKLFFVYQSIIGAVIFPCWRLFKFKNDSCFIADASNAEGKTVRYLQLCTGVFKKTFFRIPVSGIALVSVRQGIYGKYLNYGDLYIYPVNGEPYVFRYALEPNRMKSRMENLMNLQR